MFPSIPLTGFFLRDSRVSNSTGTPSASPTANPSSASFIFSLEFIDPAKVIFVVIYCILLAGYCDRPDAGYNSPFPVYMEILPIFAICFYLV
jgi:hypothetical protein